MTSTFATKFEIFDVNVSSQLLSEDDSIISPQEKKAIVAMCRKLTKGNLLEVSYSFAKGFENLRVGRVYPARAQSLGCMSTSRIRVPMCQAHYHDIDIVNCHYTIAYQYAKNRNLPHEYIKFYVENREAVISDIMERFNMDRFDAKIALLKIAYGGQAPEFAEIPNYCQSFDIESVYNDLSNIQNEWNQLAEFIWKEKKDWQSLRLRNDNHCLSQAGPNKKFKMLSLFLQTEERILLEAMNEFFTSAGRSVDVLIHDGCMIRKNGDSDFPEHLLRACEAFIKEKTSYEVKLTEKKMKMDWEFSYVPPKTEPPPPDFWHTHFTMNGKLYRENELLFDRPQEIQNAKSYVMQFHEEFNCKPQDVWETICAYPVRQYCMFGFYPYGVDVPKGVYNTFKGHPWTALFGHPGLMSNEAYKKLVEDLKNTPLTEQEQFDWDNSKTKWQIEEIFCFHNDKNTQEYNIKYFINILGNILFNTSKLCEKALCLRNSTGGSGKTGFLEKHYAEKLLGEKYFTSQSCAVHLFGDFNASIYNKLLVLCEESETKDTKKFTSNIKAAITRSRTEVRLMRTDAFPVKNHTTYIALTNKQCAFEFESENFRRFPLVDCKEHRLTSEEQKALREESGNEYYNRLLLLYILKMYDPKFNYDQLPKCDTQEELKETFKPTFFQFMDIILFEWDSYYEEKYGYLKKGGFEFHKKDTVIVKAQLFFELYKEVCKTIAPAFVNSLTFKSFIKSRELKDYITKYPDSFIRKECKRVRQNAEDSDIYELGTFYHISVDKLRNQENGLKFKIDEYYPETSD